MQRYVAFLSGLPVGATAVEQETLRSLFRKLGFLNVEIHGTTGNIAFETAPVGVTDALEAQISRHLKRSIDADIWTFIRTSEDLSRIVANAPKTDDPDGSIFVVLLAEPMDPRAAQRLRMRKGASEVLHPQGREIYWERKVTADGRSPFALADILDSPATVRSLTTITSIAEEHARPQPRRTADVTESERSRQ